MSTCVYSIPVTPAIVCDRRNTIHAVNPTGCVLRVRTWTNWLCLQVLRWSALAFGVFYGFSHQRTITATQKAQHDKHEWDQKQKLIDQAKAEYAKLKKPAAPASGDECTSKLDEAPFAQHVQMTRRDGLAKGFVC